MPSQSRFARQPPALVAITDCSPLWLQTARWAVCLTRRAPKGGAFGKPLPMGEVAVRRADGEGGGTAPQTPIYRTADYTYDNGQIPQQAQQFNFETAVPVSVYPFIILTKNCFSFANTPDLFGLYSSSNMGESVRSSSNTHGRVSPLIDTAKHSPSRLFG